MTKQEFLQAFLDLTDEEKIDYAARAGKDLYKAFGEDYEKFIGFMRATACVFAGADGIVHPTEVGIYNVATGDNLTQEQFFQMTENLLSQDGVVKSYFDLVNRLPEGVRILLAFFCLALVGFDDRFTKEEVMCLIPLLPEME